FAQASGLEFLSENSIHKGAFNQGLEYAEQELKVVEKLQSRERRAWTHFAAGWCLFFMADLDRAEREFIDGMEIAASIGERRCASLMKRKLAVLNAVKASKSIVSAERQQLFDKALQMALDNFTSEENSALLYSRFEAHRCLAEVRFRRGELDEAERLCAAAAKLLEKTESRICHLWLGPLYMGVLLASATKADGEMNTETAAAKRQFAAQLLRDYQHAVAASDSSRFKREAERLTEMMRVNGIWQDLTAT